MECREHLARGSTGQRWSTPNSQVFEWAVSNAQFDESGPAQFLRDLTGSSVQATTIQRRRCLRVWVRRVRSLALVPSVTAAVVPAASIPSVSATSAVLTAILVARTAAAARVYSTVTVTCLLPATLTDSLTVQLLTVILAELTSSCAIAATVVIPAVLIASSSDSIPSATTAVLLGPYPAVLP